jgi:hypothetical protein
MGSGQDEEAILITIGQGADDLGLFAAHHIGHSVRPGHAEAGDEVYPYSIRQVMTVQRRRESARSRRALEVGNFDPSLGTGDHSRRHDRIAAMIAEPSLQRFAENRLVPAGLDGHDAIVGRLLVKHRSIVRHQIAPQRRGAPIKPDEHWFFLNIQGYSVRDVNS